MLAKIDKRRKFPATPCLFEYCDDGCAGIGCLIIPSVQTGLGYSGCYMFFDGTLDVTTTRFVRYASCVGPLSCIEDSVWSSGLFKRFSPPQPVVFELPMTLYFYSPGVDKYQREDGEFVQRAERTAHGIAGPIFAACVRDHGLPHRLPMNPIQELHSYSVNWIDRVYSKDRRLIEIS